MLVLVKKGAKGRSGRNTLLDEILAVGLIYEAQSPCRSYQSVFFEISSPSLFPTLENMFSQHPPLDS